MTAALEQKERVALSALIQHFNPKLAQFLPEGEELLPARAGVPSETLQELFSRIHYSWIPTDRLPAELLLASLPQETAEALASQMEYEKPKTFPKAIQAFFLGLLGHQMGLAPVIPEQLLPESPCTSLLSLSKRDLVRLISILGLHDLAATFRRHIDTGPQRQILGLLTSEQERYLNWAMRQPDLFKTGPLPLAAWGQNRKAFLYQCQVQGLHRLAGALALEERSVLWYLSRRFDKGRGKLLLKQAKEKFDPHLSHRLMGQVIHIAKGLA